MDVEGRQRVAMNEATFRKVNEGMEAGQDPRGLLTSCASAAGWAATA